MQHPQPYNNFLIPPVHQDQGLFSPAHPECNGCAFAFWWIVTPLQIYPAVSLNGGGAYVFKDAFPAGDFQSPFRSTLFPLLKLPVRGSVASLSLMAPLEIAAPASP